MFGWSENGGRSAILVSTVKSVVIVGALSYLAAGWLSASTDKTTLSRLSLNASQGAIDPLTTGAIGTRVNATRLDPCTAPRR